MSDNCWLPKLECYDEYGNDWPTYEAAIYEVFWNDFISSYPLFNGVRVSVKHYPKENDKEEAFYHTTCKDYTGGGIRVPDFRRCERIRWIRAFIENYDCDPLLCENCEGVKVWNEPYKGKIRVHILLEKEKYLVVLEKHNEYYLLITAFYLDYEHALEKQLRRYEQYRIT